MRPRWLFLLILPIALPALAAPAAKTILVELNALETADNRCRLTFLIENKRDSAIDTFKVDFAVFNREGIIHRRLTAELGPVRSEKTNLRSYLVDGACDQIGSILVNDITACMPGEPGACYDALELSSRAKNVRFYK
jgi:hypothetical protein